MKEPCSLFILALLATACDEGVLSSTAGDYGVSFYDDPDCISVDVSGVALEAPFTMELYFQATSNPEYHTYPLVAWPGAFALFQNADGYTIFGPSGDTTTSSGYSTPTSFMDGAYHHIAATYDTASKATLYLDGQSVGFATVTLLETVGKTMYMGCWPGQPGAWFQGVIGEARLQYDLYYSDDFEPSWQEQDPDENTMGLWRMNEGRGTAILDETGISDGTLEGGAWADFPMDCYNPSDDPPTDTGICTVEE